MARIICKDRKDDLCTQCSMHFPDCDSSTVEFGDGVGKDNVIGCDEFAGPFDEETMEEFDN